MKNKSFSNSSNETLQGQIILDELKKEAEKRRVSIRKIDNATAKFYNRFAKRNKLEEELIGMMTTSCEDSKKNKKNSNRKKIAVSICVAVVLVIFLIFL